MGRANWQTKTGVSSSSTDVAQAIKNLGSGSGISDQDRQYMKKMAGTATPSQSGALKAIKAIKNLGALKAIKNLGAGTSKKGIGTDLSDAEVRAMKTKKMLSMKKKL